MAAQQVLADTRPPLDSEPDVVAMRVVMSGSFRRDQAGLKRVFDTFTQLGCIVLSPHSLDFVAEVDGFVYREAEMGATPASIENLHLDAIRAADFVWLHAPDGYVGQSASLELGFARALGVPVFCATNLNDPVAASYVLRAGTPDQAVHEAGRQLLGAPGAGLRALQLYYNATAKRRGYADESAQDTMLLLTEELGELARAVRKHVGLRRAGSYTHEDVGNEVADVQLYLVHLANILGTDLSEAVTRKERINDERQRQIAAVEG